MTLLIDLSDDEILYDALSPLYAAISTENLEIVKFLIEFVERYEIDENWINPVVYAFETVKSDHILVHGNVLVPKICIKNWKNDLRF